MKRPRTALQKNEMVELAITSVTNEGYGVGRMDGYAVFVPGTAEGDLVRCKIVKPLARYAFARLEQVLTASPDRVREDCAVFRRCGGCNLRHISYESECRIKAGWVRDSFERIGNIFVEHESIVPSPQPERYRNKAQYPVRQQDGELKIGFYAPHSHRIVECNDCLLQPAFFAEVVALVREFMLEYHIAGYDEEAGSGVLRHLYLRLAEATGEWMLCLVINAKELPHSEALIERLERRFPGEAFTVVLNIQTQRTNVILSPVCRVLYGRGSISDILCGRRIEISPLSFYQVNRRAAELLYGVARDYAQLDGRQTLLDLYCGAGTIGLSMADAAKELIGVEIIPQAVEDARKNACQNGVENAQFFCADASETPRLLEERQIKPDVVMLDPPRKGCGEQVLQALAHISPRRVVMISCNCATAARDCAALETMGFQTVRVRAVDLFPRTANVECVALLEREGP